MIARAIGNADDVRDKPTYAMRANSIERCTNCHLHLLQCLCALVPRLATETKLVLIMHRSETKKSTNTGRLAALCLSNSQVLIRGNVDREPPALEQAPERRALLLFPAEGAARLDSVDRTRPITLVVPDGTWGQAARVQKRVAGLAHVPCVALPPGPPSRYRVRAEHRQEGLATLEAVARAFGILEGPSVQAELERVFELMVTRTLAARGSLAR